MKLDSQLEKAVSNDAHIVILASNNDDDNVQTFLEFSTNIDLLFGWRMFHDIKNARHLALMLESINRMLPLPASPIVLKDNAPVQTPLSFDLENCVEIGTMMQY